MSISAEDGRFEADLPYKTSDGRGVNVGTLRQAQDCATGVSTYYYALMPSNRNEIKYSSVRRRAMNRPEN